jgi:hypothetical protein
MKGMKYLRTPEELWALEEKHPLMGSNPAGLLRWMYATRNLNGGRRDRSQNRKQKAESRNGNKRPRTTDHGPLTTGH